MWIKQYLELLKRDRLRLKREAKEKREKIKEREKREGR